MGGDEALGRNVVEGTPYPSSYRAEGVNTGGLPDHTMVLQPLITPDLTNHTLDLELLNLNCSGNIGSFQQLMRDACSGVLTSFNESVNCVGPYPTSCSEEKGQLFALNSVETTNLCTEDHWRDGYSAEAESDDQTAKNSGLKRSSQSNSLGVEEFVSSFSDPISREEFMSGRDLDYGDWTFGIDDTDLDSAEYEEHTPLAIGSSQAQLTKEVEDFNFPDRLDASKCSQDSGGVEKITSSALGGCGCSKPVIAQEIYTSFKEGTEAGYNKRYRPKKTSVPPDCRKPREMGAIEIAMRTTADRVSQNIFEPEVGMVFDSSEEAFEFYNMYSWEVGFGIIMNRSLTRTNDKSYRSMQEFTCQKGGTARGVNASTRKAKCKARIKLLRTEDGGWYIRDFVSEHNHDLSVGCCEKREWRSHKRIDPYTLDVIRNLRQNNVSQTKVRCIIGSMFGSLKDAPCTKRSIRTICNQIAREQMDDDVAKTIALFKKMKASDPDFKWSVEFGPNSTIKSLIWCSGKSIAKYASFGDAITFDTTYCTNVYKMPFGLFVGVNNHFQTCIFAGVLMKEETTESFKWVFREFIELMEGNPPQTVLTDQCKAMTIALGEVWPDTFHLWCKWHVFKNIREHLGPTYTKNKTFRDELYSIANEMLSKAEFVHAWKDLCERYNLLENPFMIRTFQCRSKWAKPWSKGNFCAGMTSTQRSESANMMLKKFVPRNSSMNHFVSQYNMLLQDRDMEEGRQDQTKQLDTKHSRLWPVERHAKEIYTKSTFNLFRKQVDKASSFIVSGKGRELRHGQQGREFYVISHHNPLEKQTWYKKSYKVYVLDDGERYFCECGFFEHLGIVCCHILRLMIRLNIPKIPNLHIVHRWTRQATHHLKMIQSQNKNIEPLSIWQTQLNAKALEVVTKGNTCKETIDAVMKHFKAAIKEVDEILLSRSREVDKGDTDNEVTDIETDIEGLRGNKYGASGSSAGLSDTEILNIRAPLVERGRGRPRVKRFRSASDASKKAAKRVKLTQAVKFDESKPQKVQETTEGKGKKASNDRTRCKRKASEITGSPLKNTGLPFQSRFCSKCYKPGHSKNRCDQGRKEQENLCPTENITKKDNKVWCGKCGLKGHLDKECLVVDVEKDSFFK